MAALPAVMHAATQNCLVVNLHNGQKVCYALSSTPTATFKGTELHIESESLSDDHDLATVSHFTFENCDPISVVDITAGDKIITVTDHAVTLQGFTPGAEVTLSDIQGRIYEHRIISADGSTTISIDQLTPGVYILATTDGKSLKLYKK